MEARDRPLDLHQAIAQHCAAGCPFAVVTVLRTEGSTPVKAGAKAIVEVSGAIIGTVGGGAVEAEAQRRAVEAIRDGRPVVFDFPLQGAGLSEGKPICGGVMRVVVDPTASGHRMAYMAVAEAFRSRRAGVLLTRIRGTIPTHEPAHPPRPPHPALSPGGGEGARRAGEGVVQGSKVQTVSASSLTVSLEWLDESAIASAGFPGAEAIRAVLRDEEARQFVVESSAPNARTEVLVEPIVPRPQLLIVGGGHVGQALAWQASMVGFDITVLDDRAEFTRPALFPQGTATRCGNIPGEVAAFPFAPDTFVVLVTRGAEHDAVALAACIHRPTAYLGMIGSRRKVALVRREFIESGRATEAEFDRVHAPIGLDIGAVNVPEIAASIVAELIAVRRKGRRSRA